MSRTDLNKPCIECPFRKDSIKGYLGGNSVQETLSAAVSEHEFHCHLTRETGRERECVGRLLFAKKASKYFRDTYLEDCKTAAVKNNPDLSNILGRREFSEHHEDLNQLPMQET